MTDDAKADVIAVMWVSAIVHAWVIGLSWRFWLRDYDLGLWFYGPFFMSVVFTWLVLGAALGELGERLGLFRPPQKGE